MLCGYRSYSAMAEWGRNYGARLAQALGFTHDTPCAATLHTIFRRVNRDEVEAHLGAWADSVVESLASIMASATPFCFCTTQKHLAVKRSRGSMA